MTTVSIKIKGLDELVRNLNNPGVKQLFVDAANRSVAEVKRRAIVEVPKKTHALMQSHLIKPAQSSSLSAEVYTEKEYAVPVHEGHRIVAWGHDTGRHQPANPWMERAADQSDSVINQIFDAAADKVAQNIVK